MVGVLWAVKSSTPGLSLYSQLPVVLGTSYYALSLGVNVLLTVLIAARLLAYRSAVTAALPAAHARYYVSLAAIFIESAALYSVCALLFLVTYAVNSPMNQVFLGMTNTGQQIATYLIIYRVAEGRGFSGTQVSQGTAAGEGSARGATGRSTLRFATPKKQADVLESMLASTLDAEPDSATEIALKSVKGREKQGGL